MAKLIFVMAFLTTQTGQNFASYSERQDNIENTVFVAKNAFVMTNAVQNAFLTTKGHSHFIIFYNSLALLNY